MKTPRSACGDPARPRICAMFPGALGDFICFLPALGRLAREADVDLFAQSEFADLAPQGVHVRSRESYQISRLFMTDRSDDQRLREFFAPYQRIYSWMGSRQEIFVRGLDWVAPGRAKLFAFRPAGVEWHQADYYIRCLDPEVREPARPEIEVRPEAARWCDDFRRRHRLEGKPLLAVAPGSGAREKNWPEAYFLEVIRWWRDTTGGNALVLIGPVEEERGDMERLQGACLAARGLSLAQIAALLKRSDLYLGNDSGISHLAGAVGTQSVVLFGPSNARQWAPRGRNVTVLRRGIACSPCAVETMKGCPHRACLTEFRPSDVIHRIAALQGRYLDKGKGED